MNDTGVIDTFFATFNRYIDSGFGLLGGEVAFLSTTLVAIDVTLAALFWAWSSGEDVLARLIKKTLYVGFFAFLIGNFQGLSRIVLESFSGLGLKASGAGLSAQDLLAPGKLAAIGVAAGKPLLEAAAELCGFPAFFENIVQILVLLACWILVVVAFFIMAIQIFVVLIEFKLTTLAGFVLVPFGLFGRTAFLAERVLGNVIASGVKVLVLAVVVGIGSTLFDAFARSWGGEQPTLEQVLALALAALTLLGLSIFGPGVASGLVSGAPQLGAGAAVGTGLTVGGMAMAGAGAAQLVVGGGAGLMSGAAAMAGGGRPAPGGGDGERPPPSPTPDPPPGPAGKTGGGSSGADGAGQADAAASPPSAPDSPPAWARSLQHRQTLAHGAGLAIHAIGGGDAHGAGASPSLSEDR
jgi:type IV secretion system protein TrbL